MDLERCSLIRFDYCSLIIYNIYMITEQRRQYIKDWKIKNKSAVQEKWRDWYKKNRNKPCFSNRRSIHSTKQEGTEYYGTSGIGRKYEIIAQSLLKGSVVSPNFHFPYDLEWNGVKIDVKMRNKNKKGNYHFNKKSSCTADYFFCFCVDKEIKYILLIPSRIYKQSMDLNDKSIQNKYKQYIFIIKEQ